MRSSTLHGRFVFLAATALLLLSSFARAAEVRVGASVREAYVNQPFSLTIEFVNAGSFEKPVLPEIPGAVISAEPSQSRSSLVQIVNGRSSQSETITLSYRIIPQLPGTLTIPALTMTADGQVFTSAPIEVTVTTSETGDLMFAEVVADPPSLYLGQPLHLTLHLWVKQVHDRQFRFGLSAQQMWQRIDIAGSNWGDFAEALGQRLGATNAATVSARDVTRADADGNSTAYFLYEVQMTTWPRQAGTLTIQSPTVVMNYPVRLSRGGVFGTQSAEGRPISITAAPASVEVRSPPTANQPATFAGAVGQFDLAVTAQPTDVAVGDPITLTIIVTDRGSAASPQSQLDLLQAPPLDRVAELTENFRMPSDPLAGIVRRNSKTFTQTVRAKSADVTRIPPIPFSFFDPNGATYITVESLPIALNVRPAAQLVLNDVVQSPTQTSPASTELREVAGGLMANYTDVSGLLVPHHFQITWWMMAALLAPPALFVGVSLKRLSSKLSRGDGRESRKRTARRKAITRLHAAKSHSQFEQAAVVLATIGEYIADRLNLPNGTLTSDEVATILHQHGVSASDQAEVRRLLSDCEQSAYAGLASTAADHELIARANACIARLERSRLG